MPQSILCTFIHMSVGICLFKVKTETLEQGVNMFKVNNKEPERRTGIFVVNLYRYLVSLLLTSNIFHTVFSASFGI